MDFSQTNVWSGEKTLLLSPKENTKLLQSMAGKMWQKQLFCKQVVLNFYLSLKRTEERKMVSFIKKRKRTRIHFIREGKTQIKKSLKTQQKTKKQFILAHKC